MYLHAAMLPATMIMDWASASPNWMLFFIGVVITPISLHSNTTVTKIGMDVPIVRERDTGGRKILIVWNTSMKTLCISTSNMHSSTGEITMGWIQGPTGHTVSHTAAKIPLITWPPVSPNFKWRPQYFFMSPGISVNWKPVSNRPQEVWLFPSASVQLQVVKGHWSFYGMTGETLTVKLLGILLRSLLRESWLSLL